MNYVPAVYVLKINTSSGYFSSFRDFPGIHKIEGSKQIDAKE